MTAPFTRGHGPSRNQGDRFTADDRLLVVAPHPDDESLASAGLLQKAAEAGAAVRILFLTDGENNPWAQRATELRLFLTKTQQRRFGERRRREVAAALAQLGLGSGIASFTGLPDQGLTKLLLGDPSRLVDPIREELERCSPTILAQPSLADLHPDHSATAVAVDMALRRATLTAPTRLAYVIHRPVVKGATVPSTTITLDADQRERKRRAILAHRTQHRLRGPWLVSFAREDESFVDDEFASVSGHPIIEAATAGRALRLRIESRNHPRAIGGRTLALAIDAWPEAAVTCGTLPLVRSGAPSAEITAGSARLFEDARWEGRGGTGEVMLPQAVPLGKAVVYVKVLRSLGFFDEAGWRRVSP